MIRTARLPALRAGATILAMLLLCGAIWAGFRASQTEAPAPSAAAPALTSSPDFTFSSTESGNGKGFSLRSLSGKPVLVHFWASWCGPCVQELPELARQLPALKAQGLAPVFVSEDVDWKTVKRFLAGNAELVALEREAYFFLDADHRVAGEFQSFQYPETYLLSRDQKIAHKFTGAQAWAHPEMRAFLAETIR